MSSNKSKKFKKRKQLKLALSSTSTSSNNAVSISMVNSIDEDSEVYPRWLKDLFHYFSIVGSEKRKESDGLRTYYTGACDHCIKGQSPIGGIQKQVTITCNKKRGFENHLVSIYCVMYNILFTIRFVQSLLEITSRIIC
jgi:hypothetical protein